MIRQQLKKLKTPDAPGVYLFKDAAGRPLYIGRATSLHDRTRSYFANDLIKTRGPRIVDMVTRAKSLAWQETDSILEAVILESGLIKKYQPRYNVDDRDDKSSQYVVVTDEEWPRVFLVRARDFEQDRKQKTLPYQVRSCFGPFIESGVIKEALKILRRLFPFRDKKAHDPRHEAFYRSIGRSPDGNGRKGREKYMDTIRHLTLFFGGRKRELRKRLSAKMNGYARNMRFEEAGETKRLLYALDHIDDIALIKRGPEAAAFGGFRIEAYDIAHFGGAATVGAMVVWIDGEFAKSEYRKFKISRDRNNDLANLAELLDRRLNHSEWGYPDLIVVDGNKMHVQVAESVLKARRIAIPVVAVTKDERHKAAEFLGDTATIRRYRKTIEAINTEAHRFTIRYHRTRLAKRNVI